MAGDLVTKEHLDHSIDELRGEMHAIRDELRGEMHAMEDRLRGEMRAMEGRLTREIGTVVSHFANVVIEQMRGVCGAVDERYQHVPGELAAVRRDLDAHIADTRLHKKPRG